MIVFVINTMSQLKEAMMIHFDRFDYSLVNYKSNKTKIKIVCKKHGFFEQTPKSHLKGSGCIKCVTKNSKYKKEEIIQKLIKKYENDYEYPDFEFNSLDDEITLICKKHGDVKKSIKDHLKMLL